MYNVRYGVYRGFDVETRATNPNLYWKASFSIHSAVAGISDSKNRVVPGWFLSAEQAHLAAGEMAGKVIDQVLEQATEFFRPTFSGQQD